MKVESEYLLMHPKAVIPGDILSVTIPIKIPLPPVLLPGSAGERLVVLGPEYEFKAIIFEAESNKLNVGTG